MQRVDLSGMLSLLAGLPGYAELLAGLRAGDDAAATRSPVGLVEAARPFVVAGLHRGLGRPVLVITPGTERAREYYDQLRAWTPDPERVLLFPSPAPPALPAHTLGPAASWSAPACSLSAVSDRG